jgi:hypothetical protein
MIATVEMIKHSYSGVPEDGFQRDVECPSSVITSLHRRPGMDFDKQNLLIKGLQITRWPHCSQTAFVEKVNQDKLQNWETENYIVFENIYYGSYSNAIDKTMQTNTSFPVYICDQMKPFTRFFKAGNFRIVQNYKPDTFAVNASGYTIHGYLLLQRDSVLDGTNIAEERKEWVKESLALSRDLDMTLSQTRTAQRTRDVLSEDSKKTEPEKQGNKYKSMLETRFAVFLEQLGLEFTYEKSMFELQNYDRVPGHIHTYHPDFYIKSMRLHVELKPHYPHLEELDLCEQMAQLGYDIVLFYGTDFVPLFQNYSDASGIEKRHYKQRNAIRGIGWDGQTGKRLPGEAVFVEKNGVITIECIAITHQSDMSITWTPRIVAAFKTAQELIF